MQSELIVLCDGSRKSRGRRLGTEESGPSVTEWTSTTTSSSSKLSHDRNSSSNILEWDVKSQAKEQKVRQDQIAAEVARERQGLQEVDKVRAPSDLQKKYEMRQRPYGMDDGSEAGLQSTRAMATSKGGGQETAKASRNPVPLSQLVKR